jgi:hypothetical protein
MALLLSASVGIPVLALIVFGVLEWALGQKDIFDVLQRAGLDLCHVSIGILGGIFLNQQLEIQMGRAAAIIAVVVVLLELALAALGLGFRNRVQTLGTQTTTYLCVFMGVLAVAIPSGILVWLGGS